MARGRCRQGHGGWPAAGGAAGAGALAAHGAAGGQLDHRPAAAAQTVHRDQLDQRARSGAGTGRRPPRRQFRIGHARWRRPPAARSARDARRRLLCGVPLHAALPAGALGPLDHQHRHHGDAGGAGERRDHAPALLCRLLHFPPWQGAALVARRPQRAGRAGPALPRHDLLQRPGHPDAADHAGGRQPALSRQSRRLRARRPAAGAAPGGCQRPAGLAGRHRAGAGASLYALGRRPGHAPDRAAAQ